MARNWSPAGRNIPRRPAADCAGEPFSAFPVHLRYRKGRGKPEGWPTSVSRRGYLSPSSAPPAQVNPFRPFRFTCDTGREEESRSVALHRSLAGGAFPHRLQPTAQVNHFRRFRFTCGREKTDCMPYRGLSRKGPPLPRWKVGTISAHHRHLPRGKSCGIVHPNIATNWHP